ncbi:isoaspartyl peptidase/L-asparaginase family protein [Marinicella gelatinilytica]|uniref:isoaspartyl peptidase/L-asparaginase family protein n=1 Tax=Marinicella gelatinilytica TaxID=2996017 RepID=UPI002260BDAA|nr:isoaspartyl peptidase/L-asparaginase [Marinicella gelatinilytica]MCX7545742.1 isoaspartyl peptidase/L-asparaginase [Marinicella gelatinilytica]
MRLLCVVFSMFASVVVMADKPIAIVIHGGAGTIERSQLSGEQETSIRADLSQALEVGYAALDDGQDAMDAVVAAIMVLENSTHFNAGKGAVYTREKSHELDASIMRGSDLQAGAVAGIKYTKNPILAAKAVMLNSPHVMLAGRGADAFSKTQNLEQVDNSYFDTEARLEAWRKVDEITQQKGRQEAAISDVLDHEFKFGTVGAVAIDQNGHIVAGTSTGGMTYKAWGRIGDSPVIGAGTYADDRSCGISATGHGEYFIRYAVAHDICARVLYQDKSLQQAADEVINETLKAVGGDGGIIGMDAQGKPVMIFNTAGMYRGFKTKEETYVAIYGDEK